MRDSGIDEIRIGRDRNGTVLGLVIIHNKGGEPEQVQPVEVGPFDDVMDAAATAEGLLTTQLSLW